MTENHGRARDSGDARRDDPHDPRREHRKGRRVEEAGPLVSVVIPCYKQAHFLGEAIESVLAQSYQRFEVIVVDDGSPDDTSEVAKRYGHAGVRCVRQENRGLAGARNAGLRRSEGEYVVFLDADDRLLPGALEAGLGSFEAHPECAFVSGHYKEISVDGSPLSTEKQPCPEREHYVEILRANYIVTPAVVMYRRAVFDSVGGFNTSLSVRGTEDFDLCLRIAREFPIYCHGKVVAEYRLHGTSMSHNSALMLRSTITVCRSQRKHVKGNKRYEEAIEEGVRVGQNFYGMQLVYELLSYVRKHEWKRAVRGMLMLLRYYPRGFASLNEHYRLARQLQANERRLRELESRLVKERQKLKLESRLVKERQKLKQLKRQNKQLKRQEKRLWLKGGNRPLWLKVNNTQNSAQRERQPPVS